MLNSEIQLAKENIKRAEIKFNDSNHDKKLAINELMEAEEILYQLITKRGEVEIENDKNKRKEQS